MPEIINSNNKRLTEVIADFDSDGFAIGWQFKVATCFRDALDIKRTERTINKVKTLAWTQGAIYDFKKGDTIMDYCCRDEWGIALKKIRYCLQVESAMPCFLEEIPQQEHLSANESTKQQARYKLNAGFVKFQFFCPNMEKSRLELIGTRECSQIEFVKILKTGLPVDVVTANIQTSLF